MTKVTKDQIILDTLLVMCFCYYKSIITVVGRRIVKLLRKDTKLDLSLVTLVEQNLKIQDKQKYKNKNKYRDSYNIWSLHHFFGRIQTDLGTKLLFFLELPILFYVK